MRTEEKIVETVERKKIKAFCDLCRKEATEAGVDSCEWDKSWHGTDRIEISRIVGIQYPGTGWGTKIVIDLCPNCFMNTFIPWLEGLGVKIQEQKWDH